MSDIPYCLERLEAEFQILRHTYLMVQRERDNLAVRYDQALKRINDLTAELEYLRREVNRG
jgi:hypothetical protein